MTTKFLLLFIYALLPCCSRSGSTSSSDNEVLDAARSEARMCELAGNSSPVLDWVREWGTYFPVEDGGVLIKATQPASSLETIKQSLSILNPKGRVYVTCGQFILLWMPCGQCNIESSDWQMLRRMIGPNEVLHSFDPGSFELVKDCLGERIPQQRCRKRMSGLLSVLGCGGGSRDDRRERNQLMIKLGLAEPGSSVCLGINDK